MKIIALASVISLISFSSFRSVNSTYHNIHVTIDTGRIIHKLDGAIDEWPQNKFETDNGTNIQYAADNDGNDLYLALKIPDVHTQTKIMRQGMELYLDTKGKKKESKGIEFPMKKAMDNSLENLYTTTRSQENNGTDEQQKPNMKKMRAMMALNLISMKLIGFAGAEDEQGLTMNGSANIAFTWDPSDVMFIEYRIPLSLLDEKRSMNGKEISIGWKLNGIDVSRVTSGQNNEGGSSGGRGMGGGGGRRFNGGGGGGGGYRSSGSGDRQQQFEKFRQDQSFWTKYTITSN